MCENNIQNGDKIQLQNFNEWNKIIILKIKYNYY